MKLADRMQGIQPFFVMDILARARQLEAEGRSIIHMEIGEPDFPTPDPIIEAGRDALAQYHTHYTPALGLPALRQRIADYYRDEFNVAIDASRVIITPGASGALQLALGTLVNAGNKVIMADPGYPCNRHMVSLFNGSTTSIAVTADTDYQLTTDLIRQHWDSQTVAAMLATPSNPTGTMLDMQSMQQMASEVTKQGGCLIVDEIYQGLVYDRDNITALACEGDLVVINSFSKYFGMTGWRLGWMVVPDQMIDAVDRLAQNIFLAPSTPAQHAALVAFDSDSMRVMQQRRDEFKQRRDYLLPELTAVGFKIESQPQGAFYIYADCSELSNDSFELSQQLLEQAGVAVTPGKDFGFNQAERYLRFAYTQPIDKLAEGVKRIQQFLNKQK